MAASNTDGRDDAPTGRDDDGAAPGAPGPPEGPAEPAARDTPEDVETAWARIVAELGDLDGFDEPAAPADGERRGTSGAVAADGTLPRDDGATRADGADRADRADRPDDRPAARDADAGGLGSIPVAPWVRATGPRDWPTTPEVEALEDEDDHFVPPEPPPLGGRDPLTTLAWALVAGVPLVAVLAVLVLGRVPVVAAQVAGGLFLAGVGVLVWRMPHRRDDDDGPGAVV